MIRTILMAAAIAATAALPGAPAHAADKSSAPAAKIEQAMKDLEDNQSLDQFEIQVGTSDLQNAENVRSQAEKRLEQQRKDLTRNWGG